MSRLCLTSVSSSPASICHFAAKLRLSAFTFTKSQLTLAEYLSHEPAPPLCSNLKSWVAWGPACMVNDPLTLHT